MERAMMRGAVSVLVAMLAGPVAALTPLLECDLGDPEGGIEGYSPWTVVPDFVTYQSYETGGSVEVYVLEQCSTRRQLILRMGTGETDAATDAAAFAMLDEMTFGEGSYTMSEMAERLRGLGGVVVMRDVNYQSCACASE
jgi:hypothetical protein